MELIQSILVYITLALALGYLVKKFVLPKKRLATKKGNIKGCGEDRCGCD